MADLRLNNRFAKRRNIEHELPAERKQIAARCARKAFALPAEGEREPLSAGGGAEIARC